MYQPLVAIVLLYSLAVAIVQLELIRRWLKWDKMSQRGKMSHSMTKSEGGQTAELDGKRPHSEVERHLKETERLIAQAKSTNICATCGGLFQRAKLQRVKVIYNDLTYGYNSDSERFYCEAHREPFEELEVTEPGKEKSDILDGVARAWKRLEVSPLTGKTQAEVHLAMEIERLTTVLKDRSAKV